MRIAEIEGANALMAGSDLGYSDTPASSTDPVMTKGVRIWDEEW